MVSVTSTFQRRFVVLRWALPIVLGLLAVLYEIGPGRRIHDDYSVLVYFDLDIAFYGLAVPLLTFSVLSLLSHWLSRKEQAEKQARASEQRLAAIITASADAIIGLNANGMIEAWNRGAELLFETEAGEAYGKTLPELFGGGEAAKTEFRWLAQQAQSSGFVRGHEAAFHSVTGHEVAVEITATYLVDDAGNPMGMSVILRDITDRKRRDEEIQHLNASLNEQVASRTRELREKVEQLAHANDELQRLDQTRSEFVSLVSHQVRAPLTNMRGAVERMGNDCSVVNATCSRMFIILDQQAARLNRLVNDVLNAARLESGELVVQVEPMSVLPVIEQAVEQIRARTTTRVFRIADKPGLPLALADRDRVTEVLINLLDNADKYSPASGEIFIDVAADETEITLSVRDSGRGLPSNDLDRIFDKFYRADSSDSQSAYGYGLGLYVCRQLVLAQNGRIWAENFSSGAVFSFTLPIAG